MCTYICAKYKSNNNNMYKELLKYIAHFERSLQGFKFKNVCKNLGEEPVMGLQVHTALIIVFKKKCMAKSTRGHRSLWL